MKDPNYYTKDLMSAVVCSDPHSLADIIRRIQDDAAMDAFQNTTETFNMDSLQGEDITNCEILEILQK